MPLSYYNYQGEGYCKHFFQAVREPKLGFWAAKLFYNTEMLLSGGMGLTFFAEFGKIDFV